VAGFDESRAIRFTEHAEKRGAVRAISRDDVIHAIKNPDKIEPAQHGCHNVWGRTPSGKRIRVTINFKANVVVTVANADWRLK
jgi:hypothetical protein